MAGETYRLDGLAVPEELDRLHQLLGTVTAQHPELPTEVMTAVATAALEIANNVVEHARPTGAVRWSIEVRVEPGAVVTELSDSGTVDETPWLPPGAASGSSEAGTMTVPEMPDPLEEAGRGLPIAAALVDDLAYRVESGRNVWTLRKRLGGS